MTGIDAVRGSRRTAEVSANSPPIRLAHCGHLDGCRLSIVPRAKQVSSTPLCVSPAAGWDGYVHRRGADRELAKGAQLREVGRWLNASHPLVVPTMTLPLPSTATQRPLGVHDTPVRKPWSSAGTGGE